MTKEYLKMSDVFSFDVGFDSDGGIGAVVDSQGEYIAQAMENNYCSHMSNKDKNGYRNKVARYVAHSVASHDELVAEVERLREELSVASNVLDEVDRVLSEMQKNGVLVYGLDDLIDEVRLSIQSQSES